ncbi:MAG TPA: beta-propeller fold lactonase family protein [Candidatus Acidoferrum sp.]|nr:beta-propeller fold lactonase family protein [Candidatus Acidoferrum sp.]
MDQLNSITVSPSLVTLGQNATQAYTAAGHFTLASGSASDFDVSSQVTWNSSNTNVATIDNTGHATTTGVGSTTITATSCDGLTVGTATLLVASPAADSLLVAPATITISTGTTTLFTVMEKLANGTIQALPPGTVVAWSSDTSTVATVDANSGVALGVAAGTANIIASSTGLNPGAAVLTVQAATARFAYIANKQGNGVGGALGAGSISIYTVDAAGGTFTEVAGSPFPANNPQQVLFHPSGHLMYYINSSSRIITNFIDPSSNTGGFIDAQRTAYVAGTGVNNVGVIDPFGRFLYVIEDTGTIYGFSIAQTQVQATNGVLTAIPGLTAYTDATLNVPTWVMTDRAGKYLYVVNDGNATISEYSIDQSTGELTPLSTPTISTGDGTNFPLFGTTDVNGHLYVGNFGDVTAGSVDSVSAYTIDTSSGPTAGQLTSAGPDKVIPTATQTINVITDPTGKFIYVLDQNATSATAPGQVFAFNLDPVTGLIGNQIGIAQPCGATPLGMAIDPTGALLAVDNNIDNTISLFKVTLTGASAGGLSTQTTVPTDQIPQFVVFYTAASTQ